MDEAMDAGSVLKMLLMISSVEAAVLAAGAGWSMETKSKPSGSEISSSWISSMGSEVQDSPSSSAIVTPPSLEAVA